MTAISETTAKIASPLIVVSAVALLLQGHQLPGGGFIGGVLTVSAFALIYIVFSIDYLEETVLERAVSSPGSFVHRIQEDYRHTFALGLLLALGTGLTATAFELPFLTHKFTKIHTPIYGELELASAFSFDLGVYLVVVGGLLTAVSVVGEE